ncbi:MAG: zf-HC2 domain-containing protein [Planctomycetota bacterium]
MTEIAGRCQETRLRLDDWLDNLLDPVVRAAVDDHLAECPACYRVFDRHRMIEGDLLALGAAAERIADAGTRTPFRSRSWWRSAIGVAAVVAILVTVGFVTIGSRGTGNRDRRIAREPSAGLDSTGVARLHTRGADEPIVRPNVFAVATGDRRMAVEMESSNPRIHVVWFYDQVLPTEAPGEVEGSDAPGTSGIPKGV